ncbi:MAG: hypothetical protein AAFX09_08500 [Pseudomonadota bacterium]
MPAFIAGKSFDSVSLQFDGQSWPKSFQFSEVIDPDSPSTFSIPELGCTANLFVLEASEERVVFKQRLTEGQGVCTDLGYLEVRYEIVADGPVFAFSPTRRLQPVYTTGILSESRFETSADTLSSLAQQMLRPDRNPPIIGNWAGSGWRDRTCYQTMLSEPVAWLPAEPVGELTIWAVTGEADGRVFAAWVNPDVRSWVHEAVAEADIQFTELRHWSDRIFEAPDGLMGLEGPRLLSPDIDRQTGETVLYIVRPDSENRDERRLPSCRTEN